MPSGRRAAPVGAIVLSAVFLTPLGVAGTAIALPAIADDLGATSWGLQWAVNGFNIAFAVFMIIGGVFADRFGYRLTFVVGLACLFGASVASGLSPSFLVLDASRLVAGVGSATIIAGGVAAISEIYPEGPVRARSFALFGTTVGIGLALGPSLSGALVATVGWRGLYGMLAASAAVVLAMSPLLPRPGVERDPDQKTVDFSPLRPRRFLAFCLVPVAPAVGFVTMLTYLPVALSAMFDMTAARSAVFMLPMTLPVLVGPLMAAHLVRRVHRINARTIIYASIAALLIGSLGMLLLSPGVQLGWFVVPLALLGLGYGLPMGLVDVEAVSSVPERSSGTAGGAVNFIRTGSAAIAVGAYGAMMAVLIGTSLPAAAADRVAAGGAGHPQVYASAFHTAVLVVLAIIGVLGVLIVWLHRGTGIVAVGRTSRPPDAERGDR